MKAKDYYLNNRKDFNKLLGITEMPLYSKSSRRSEYIRETENFGAKIVDFDTGVPCCNVYISLKDGKPFEVVDGYYKLRSIMKSERSFKNKAYVKVHYFDCKFDYAIYRTLPSINQRFCISQESRDTFKNLVELSNIPLYLTEDELGISNAIGYRISRGMPSTHETITIFESYANQIARDLRQKQVVFR